MLLIYNDKEMKLNRDQTAFNTVIEKVNDIVEQEDKVFSHLLIDNQPIYEEHENYIADRLQEIIQIEIVVKTTYEMIWETMESVYEYLERGIPAIVDLVNKSADGFDEQTWNSIEQLTEGMQWMLQFVEFTRQNDKHPMNWENINNDFKRFEDQLPELLGAVEVQDTILISDIISYEIIPIYTSLKDEISTSLNDKGFLDYVN